MLISERLWKLVCEDGQYPNYWRGPVLQSHPLSSHCGWSNLLMSNHLLHIALGFHWPQTSKRFWPTWIRRKHWFVFIIVCKQLNYGLEHKPSTQIYMNALFLIWFRLDLFPSWTQVQQNPSLVRGLCTGLIGCLYRINLCIHSHSSDLKAGPRCSCEHWPTNLGSLSTLMSSP